MSILESAARAWIRKGVPPWAKWTLVGIGLLWVVLLTWQLVLGTLWQDAIPLERLTNRSEQPGVFWAYLPRENRARLPFSRAGTLVPAELAADEVRKTKTIWRWRGARDLVKAPGEFAFTSSTVWLRIPDDTSWEASVLHLPRAVSGPWLLVAWGLFLGALWWASPRMRGLCQKTPPPWWKTALIFVTGAFLLSLWRKPEWLLSPQLVNEDMWVFAYEAWREGLPALWHPYAGYWHLLPRLGAAMAAGLSPAWWPLAYATMAWGLTTGLGLLVAFSRLCPDWRGRLLMGWALFFVPHGGEVYFQLYNIQWIALGVVFLLVIQPAAESWLQRWFEAGVVLLLGLTTPGVILAVPLLAARLMVVLLRPDFCSTLWPRRSLADNAIKTNQETWPEGNQEAWLVHWTKEIPIICAGGLAAGVQLFSALGETATDRGSQVLQPLLLLLENFLFTSLPAIFPASWGGMGATASVIAAGLWVGGLAFLWWVTPRETQWPVALLLAGGLAILTLGFLRPAGGEAIDLANFSPQGEGSRYYFFFGLAVIWGTVLMVFNQKKPWARRGGVLLLVALVWAQSTHLRAGPNADFEWANQAEKLEQALGGSQAGSPLPLQFPHGNTWVWEFPRKERLR